MLRCYLVWIVGSYGYMNCHFPSRYDRKKRRYASENRELYLCLLEVLIFWESEFRRLAYSPKLLFYRLFSGFTAGAFGSAFLKRNRYFLVLMHFAACFWDVFLWWSFIRLLTPHRCGFLDKRPHRAFTVWCGVAVFEGVLRYRFLSGYRKEIVNGGGLFPKPYPVWDWQEFNNHRNCLKRKAFGASSKR